VSSTNLEDNHILDKNYNKMLFIYHKFAHVLTNSDNNLSNHKYLVT